ncbi:MAG: 50S ribosomal protein L30 [Pseudomonadota bacterium]|nr:50S ribosomal protein L30 [Pseudomonadota bacterium]
MSDTNRIRVTLVRSRHGRLASHQACLTGLGLKRIGQSRELIDTASVRGMVNKVRYLINVEELGNG